MIIGVFIWFLVEPYFIGGFGGLLIGAYVGTEMLGIIGTAIGAILGLIGGLLLAGIYSFAIGLLVDLFKFVSGLFSGTESEPKSVRSVSGKWWDAKWANELIENEKDKK